MKTIVGLALSLLALVPVKAQVFRPETVNGAVLGGIAGAVIGNNSGDLHHNAWKGAAIGTVAGALIGSAVADSNDYHRRTQVPVPSGYYSGYYSYRPYNHAYGYRSYYRPSYASRGLLLGGITGAIIGNNSHHHNAWRGAAWGAGAGLVLGALADEESRYYDDRVVVVPAASEPAATPATAPAQSPQNVTIINNYYGNSSPMGTANGMFGR
jgi:outer membrane lipoprotein SlyB